jgi:hypothetical protein
LVYHSGAPPESISTLASSFLFSQRHNGVAFYSTLRSANADR